jgi:hypothetical protein
MDEKTQYNCDKIFNISNHIYNCIKKVVSPSGMQVDYTSMKSIWSSFIGFNITLSQEEFNDLNNKCKHLRSLLDRIEYIIGIIKGLDMEHKCHYINNNAVLFDMYFDDFNNTFDFINKDIQYLQKKDIYRSNIIPEKDNIIKGTKWIFILFDFYLKYEGKKQVSTSEFFYHIRDIWDKIDNDESIEITHILENILGGVSIKNISHNLRDWLMKNGDVVVMYRGIIDVSLEPKDFEVLEFDPHEYVMVTLTV